jgi:gamma-glutamyltranspeptidase/glutathione hydrolase
MVPAPVVTSRRAAAASADQIATQAAMSLFERGGNAVDAAIAANAVLTVTAPHLCGLGGDLFALVHDGAEVHALNASGRAGAGVDAAALRAEGHSVMPFRHHPAAVTIPGCVDGWLALHDRFGSRPLGELLAPAVALAGAGFLASPLLAGSLSLVDEQSRHNLIELADQATAPGALVRRPGVARTLEAIGSQGRAAFYGGEFGRGLVELTGGLISAADLDAGQADWQSALRAEAFGVTLHTIAPNSQGYLTLGSAITAETLGLPEDPDSQEWLNVLVRAAVVAGTDRPAVLHERADGHELLEVIAERARTAAGGTGAEVDAPPTADGDTTYLCTAERGGLAVSLIQSNASGFGSGLVEPSTAINVQNRGLGFSLQEGHPAELAPGRRPPHTLAPALATYSDGRRIVFGTMGGDAQPQILLQLAARLFHHGERVGSAVAAPRWVLRGPSTGFDTWDGDAPPSLVVEGHAPDAWATAPFGYAIRRSDSFTSEFGHAHAIVDDGEALHAAADPRAVIGAAAGR